MVLAIINAPRKPYGSRCKEPDSTTTKRLLNAPRPYSALRLLFINHPNPNQDMKLFLLCYVKALHVDSQTSMELGSLGSIKHHDKNN